MKAYLERLYSFVLVLFPFCYLEKAYNNLTAPLPPLEIHPVINCHVPPHYRARWRHPRGAQGSGGRDHGGLKRDRPGHGPDAGPGRRPSVRGGAQVGAPGGAGAGHPGTERGGYRCADGRH